ncbi:MAG: chromate transporter [Acetobacteraceae bacterium]|nr:chromate transporter [Acetobacteraceae bacterium]
MVPTDHAQPGTAGHELDGAAGSPARPAPTRTALFGGFFLVGIFGFGGVLAMARRMIVEQRKWLSPGDFTDLLALCQFLPGPNTINVSVALGSRFRGPSGALAAFSGLMAAPLAIIIALGILYQRYSALPTVRHTFAGLAAAASGLVMATAVKIAAPLRHNPAAIATATACFGAIALLHVPLLWTMVVLAPFGILLAAPRA